MAEHKISNQQAEKIKKFLEEIDYVLCILTDEEKTQLPKEYTELIKEREKAREEKNYKRADEIRNYLKSKGVIIEDTPYGTRWKKE